MSGNCHISASTSGRIYATRSAHSSTVLASLPSGGVNLPTFRSTMSGVSHLASSSWSLTVDV